MNKSFLLFVPFTFATFLQAFAESDSASGLEFVINEENAIITGRSQGNTSTSINFPKEVKGEDGKIYKVTGIGDDAFKFRDLTAVTFPETLITLGEGAFAGNKLKKIVIPHGVETISNRVFSDNQITSVSLPNSVKKIESWAFDNNLLTSITLPENIVEIGSWAFEDNQISSVIFPSSMEALGVAVFRNNNLNSNSEVAFLGNYSLRFSKLAFADNPELKSVTACKSSIGWSGLRNFHSDLEFKNDIPSIQTESCFREPPAAPLLKEVAKNLSAYGKGWLYFTQSRSGAVITNYEISINGQAFEPVYPPVSISPIFLSGLRNGVTYEFKLRAISNKGLGAESEIIRYRHEADLPEIPQQSLTKIARTDGAKTNSTISIGSSSDNGETYSTSFTIDDEVILTAKIYPDSSDLGEEGELYVVMRSTIDGKKTFTALNEDGIWEAWNASLKTLPAAKYVESLEEVEDVLVYSGTITAGERLIYVGYSLFTAEGKPVITTSLSPYKITVSE